MKRDWALAALLCAGLWLVYNLNLNWGGSGDTEPAKVLPLELLLHGTLTLDAFMDSYAGGVWPEQPYWVTRSGGHAYSFYPLVTPLLVTPLYVPLALYVKHSQLPLADPRALWLLAAHAKMAASLITALSAGFLYLSARGWLERRPALLLTLIYALASAAWSTSSQTLWQHGTSSLLMTCSLLGCQRGTGPGLAASGAAAALAFCNRPPNAIFAAVLSLYVIHKYRRGAWPFFLFPPVLGGAFLAYNVALFGNPLGPQSAASQWGFPRHLGLLVAPSRGLIVYSPWVLASFWGIVRVWTRPPYDALLRCISVVVVAEFLVYSCWLCWWGGGCFGPRLTSDLNCLLALLLIPFLRERPGGVLVRAAFLALVAYSVAVQVVGVVFWYPYMSTRDLHWSWKQSQLAETLKTWRLLRPAALREWTSLEVVLERAFLQPSSAPLEDFSSGLELVGKLPSAAPGAPLEFTVRVRNDGRRTWSCRETFTGPRTIRLGYKWFQNGEFRSEGRVLLPRHVPPGTSLLVRVSIPAPPAGRYTLQLAMVQEMVSWFHPSLELPVVVAPPQAFLDVGTESARADLKAGFFRVDEHYGPSTFVWAEWPEAVIGMRCTQPGTCTLQARAVAPESLIPVTVSVDVNGRFGGTFTVGGDWALSEVTLPDVPAGDVLFRLRFDKATAPGHEGRRLCVAIDYIQLGAPQAQK